MLHAAGPLGPSIVHDTEDPPGPEGQPNAQIVLRRIAWVTERGSTPDGKEAKDAYERLWRWALPRISRHPNALLEAAHRRRDAALRRLQSRGHHVEVIEARPVWRAVVGLGDEVPQETGMRLHGTYGVPILPGQSLKGLAAIEGSEDPESSELVPDVMGSPRPGGDPKKRGLGQVIFLDALPIRTDIAMDVMTPHVAEYYGDTVHPLPPAEYWQPNPVSFLVLTRSTRFRIHVIGRGADAEDVAGFAKAWLIRGLTYRGIGAKTSAGYGYMAVTQGQ